MSNLLFILWITYTGFTLISFLYFGQFWMRHVQNWHIGFMSSSYTMAVMLLAAILQRQISDGPPLEPMQVFALTAVLITGLLGLARYWFHEWQRLILKHEMRRLHREHNPP